MYKGAAILNSTNIVQNFVYLFKKESSETNDEGKSSILYVYQAGHLNVKGAALYTTMIDDNKINYNKKGCSILIT